MPIELITYPDGIGHFSSIRCSADDFELDLKDIIEKSGNKDAFKGLYVQRLQFLSIQKERCYLRSNWFERLKHDSQHRLYSMKFNSGRLGINPRILFICVKDCIILLNAFNENSDTSYRKNIEIANKRIDELIKSSDLEGEDIICHNI